MEKGKNAVIVLERKQLIIFIDFEMIAKDLILEQSKFSVNINSRPINWFRIPFSY